MKPQIELRKGKLFLNGKHHPYVRRKVLDRRGKKLVILDKPETDVLLRDPHFVANEIRLTISEEHRSLLGKASLTTGSLGVLGNDSHRTSKAGFDFYRGPWDAWPEWSASMTCYGDRDADVSDPDTWWLTAYLPHSVFDDLTDTYKRDALDRLAFTFVSDLWQQELYSDGTFSYDRDWYLAPQNELGLDLVAAGKLADFEFTEKSVPIGTRPEQSKAKWKLWD